MNNYSFNNVEKYLQDKIFEKALQVIDDEMDKMLIKDTKKSTHS